jgi:hypothetical protein
LINRPKYAKIVARFIFLLGEAVPPMVDPDLIAGMCYDNSLALGEDGQPLKFDGKNRDLGSKQYTEQAESRLKKQALILEVRDTHAKNLKCQCASWRQASVCHRKQ